jgi:serine/threonine protein phosphatase PrpC
MTTLRNQATFCFESRPKSPVVQLNVQPLPSGEAGCANGKALLGYRRCCEYDNEDGGEGQDYAWLWASSRQVIGVVADGVSQSFYGQIAAQFLVKSLAPYLQQGHLRDDSDATKQALIAELCAIAQDAAKEVQTYKLGKGLSAAMQDVLNEDREKSGSQAVFGAFVFDRDTGRVVACQLGDVRFRVFCQDLPHQIRATEIQANAKGRFSTIATARSGGSTLQTNLVIRSFTNVVGVVLHSDGVDARWSETLESQQHRDLVRALEYWADKDDVSVVAVLTEPLLEWAEQKPLALLPGDGTNEPAGNGYVNPGVGTGKVTNSKATGSDTKRSVLQWTPGQIAITVVMICLAYWLGARQGQSSPGSTPPSSGNQAQVHQPFNSQQMVNAPAVANTVPDPNDFKAAMQRADANYQAFKNSSIMSLKTIKSTLPDTRDRAPDQATKAQIEAQRHTIEGFVQQILLWPHSIQAQSQNAQQDDTRQENSNNATN